MLKVEMLPAGHGDCLWIEYGSPIRRILIDSGPSATHKAIRKRLSSVDPKQRTFELLVVTHVDVDHIGGLMKLLDQPPDGLAFKEVWFNGYRHLTGLEEFGPVDGETLTKWLLSDGGGRWNTRFGAKAVVRPDHGTLPRHVFDGDLTITVLGPTQQKLKDLQPVWEKVCRDAGIAPGVPTGPPTLTPPGIETFGPMEVDAFADAPFVEDSSEANGSCISLLLEYEGKRILLAADAHPSTITAGIELLPKLNGRLQLDALKVLHHGSKYNVSRALLDRVKCRRYLFSTNGAHYRHPDREGVARAVKYGGDNPLLMFNYRTKFNETWDDEELMKRWGFSVEYGGPAAGLGLML